MYIFVRKCNSYVITTTIEYLGWLMELEIEEKEKNIYEYTKYEDKNHNNKEQKQKIESM